MIKTILQILSIIHLFKSGYYNAKDDNMNAIYSALMAILFWIISAT